VGFLRVQHAFTSTPAAFFAWSHVVLLEKISDATSKQALKTVAAEKSIADFCCLVKILKRKTAHKERRRV
jgi:hypothetical protein